MLNDLKAILYFFAIDMRYSFLIFWTIFITSSVFLLVLSYSFSINMVVSVSVATYIYCGIAGFLQTKITLPYSIRFGFTRTRYVVGNLVFNFFLAITISIIHLVYNYVLNGTASFIGADTFSLMTTVEGTTLANTWYYHFLVDVMFCSLTYSVCLLFGAVFYRLGLVGGLVAIAALVLSIFIPETRNMIIDHFVAVNNGDIRLSIPFIPLIMITLLCSLPVWALLRNATTTPGIAR